MDEINTSEIKAAKTIFTGYESLQEKAKIVFVKPVEEGVVLVFVQTPFYARGGGQIADLGTIDQHQVIEVRNWDGFYLHLVDTKKPYQIGEQLDLIVDFEKRQNISILHSLAHVYWGEIERLLDTKFDQTYELITHDDATLEMVSTEEKFITPEILEEAIKIVDHDIKLSVPTSIYFENNDLDKRVVTWNGISKDYCGGTHVKNTSELKSVVILKFKKKAGKHRIKFTFEQ
ncbi:alanine--tRNA ligase-related protein [Williamsoniiplasma lucivorax]|uniref:alanine--tRNA ligase-related protein n=1 Tax=Williamsoniiplasma lucivorax TaxID=209274 RepID=UPI00146F9F65|nr:alanine--tRNA ligase-related protein [Williamsoniiplasma lucivorax]